MVKKWISVQMTLSIFRQDMTAGPSETNLQFSIGSHVKQTRSKILAFSGRVSFSGVLEYIFLSILFVCALNFSPTNQVWSRK